MDNNIRYKKYKAVKKQLTYFYKGYPIHQIVALDLLINIYVDRKYTLKTIASLILKRILPDYFKTLSLDQLECNDSQKTLFSMGLYERKDYYEIWEYAKLQVDSYYDFDFSKQQVKYKFSFLNILKAWSILNRAKGLSFIICLKLSSQIAYYLNLIDDLEKLNIVVGKYCSFSSVHEHETILTSYFKKRGIETYSLQHAKYSVYKKQVPLDAVLYENFISDYYLCWGESTKDEFSEFGIDRDSLLICGYPRDIDRPEVPQKVEKRNCLVLLARYSYQHSNVELLNILEKFSQKFNVKFSLKLHPSLIHVENVYSDYSKRNGWEILPYRTTITELFQQSSFGWSIAVNTGAYYEAYLYNIPCLRFNDGSFEDSVDIMDDTFGTLEQLVSNYQKIPADDKHEIARFFSQVDKKLDYAIGIRKNNYRILNSKTIAVLGLICKLGNYFSQFETGLFSEI